MITGGASGIGLATARLLAAEGVQLVLADIEKGRWSRSGGARPLGVIRDVGNLASVRHLADQSYERFGAVHLLFNNAGVAVGGPVASMTQDQPGDRKNRRITASSTTAAATSPRANAST